MAAAQAAVEKHRASHLASAYKGVFVSLRSHVADGSLSAVEVAAAQRTVELNKLEQVARFRRGLGVLATVGSTAPFVGLLGTTMGVVNAFVGMADMGTGGLTAISAGIAEALITTEYGLIVAIPSLLLHAFLSRKSRGIQDEMEKAAIAFVNQVAKTPLAANEAA